MATTIRNVYHTDNQDRTVIILEATTESCLSYNLIWTYAKTVLQSQFFLIGIRCQYLFVFVSLWDGHPSKVPFPMRNLDPI